MYTISEENIKHIYEMLTFTEKMHRIIIIENIPIDSQGSTVEK